jgi:hypothetical protein
MCTHRKTFGLWCGLRTWITNMELPAVQICALSRSQKKFSCFYRVVSLYNYLRPCVHGEPIPLPHARESVVAICIHKAPTIGQTYSYLAAMQGVMAFDAIVGRPTMMQSTLPEIRDRALGQEQYPWEKPSAELPEQWQRSRLRPLVQPCLARDAERRPTAAALVQSLAQIGDLTTPA